MNEEERSLGRLGAFCYGEERRKGTDRPLPLSAQKLSLLTPSHSFPLHHLKFNKAAAEEAHLHCSIALLPEKETQTKLHSIAERADSSKRGRWNVELEVKDYVALSPS